GEENKPSALIARGRFCFEGFLNRGVKPPPKHDIAYCYDARRVPEKAELPNSPKTTVPLSWSPSIEPLNSRVNGMGSVMDIFHDSALPSTTPSNISVEFPSAIWLPCNVLPSVLRERTPRRSPKGVVTTRSQLPSAVMSGSPI